jgi:hypothetical protein
MVTFAPFAAAPFEIFDAQPFEAGLVTGAPFTADAVTEMTQTLSDGNRIERTLTSSIARDGRGRVRREEQIALMAPLAAPGDAPPTVVTITDPERGHFTLDERQRVAIQMPAPGMKIATRVARAGASVERDVTFVFNGAAGAGAPAAVGAAGGAVRWRAAAAAPSAAKTEKLGERQIEGVAAEGTRTTVTIPARAIGNVNPIEIVSERWYSSELQMPVLITRRDPRAGETVYRLVNIVRGEPRPDLFEVPPDYTLRKPPVPPLPPPPAPPR